MEKPRYYFIGDRKTVDLDFATLRFEYTDCPYRFEAIFEHGVWRVRGLLEDNELRLPEGSQCLHYGQQLFEGMKALTGADGKVYAFRPRDNARRMSCGATYLRGPEVPEELFIRGVEEVVAANFPYIPPYGSGAALYLRPFYLGIGDNVGVKPASRYLFRVFVTPVGPYFREDSAPTRASRSWSAASTGRRRTAPDTSRPAATTPAPSPPGARRARRASPRRSTSTPPSTASSRRSVPPTSSG